MRNGDFSRYYDVSSPIHFLNPLCKIHAFIVFVLMAFLGSGVRVLGSLFIILIYLIIFSNISLKKYLAVLFRLRFLLIFLFIVDLFFISFYDSIIIVSRICLIVMYYFVLLFTTTTNELSYGLYQLFKPLSNLKFPVFRVSMCISLIFNFIPCLFLEFDRIVKSRTSRCPNYFGFLNRFIIYISNVKMTFVFSFRHFVSLFDSLKLRDFSFIGDKSNVFDSRFRLSDVYMILCHIMIFIFVLIKEVVL